MWKKLLAGTTALVLVMVAFAGAVFAQAENTVRVSEKIGNKIGDYKAAHPEWTKRLKYPERKLAVISTVVAGMSLGIAFAIGFYDGYVLGGQVHAPSIWAGTIGPVGEFYFAGYRLGKAWAWW